jgi:hypothetical protein
MRFEGWKLGCIEVWSLGGIYSPNHQKNRWWGLLSYGAPDSPVRRQTLSSAPATSPGRWVLTVGAYDNRAPNSPVLHQTVTVHCPVHLLAPALAFARVGAHCSVSLFLCRRPLALYSRYSAGTSDSPMLHRTVRWIIAERPPEFLKVASLELSSLVHRTLSGGAPDSPVVHRTVRCARPGKPSVALLLSFWTLSLNFVLVYCEPLELII